MKTMDRPFIYSLANGAFVGLTLGALTMGLTKCTAAQLSSVQDASSKRDTICAFVEAWSQNRPELTEVQQLCQAGKDLKEIAAAYAGCHEPLEPDNG